MENTLTWLFHSETAESIETGLALLQIPTPEAENSCKRSLSSHLDPSDTCGVASFHTDPEAGATQLLRTCRTLLHDDGDGHR
jgi:hypothetical protein